MSAHNPTPRSAWIFPALAVRGASVGPGLGAQRRAAADCAAGGRVAGQEILAGGRCRRGQDRAPPAFAGLLVALLILLPEGVAAVSAVRKNDLQKSINLALGSSLATIGLTIPAVGVATYALDKELTRGLSGLGSVLLLLTFSLSMLTFATSRTNVLFGLVHMVVFAVY